MSVTSIFFSFLLASMPPSLDVLQDLKGQVINDVPQGSGDLMGRKSFAEVKWDPQFLVYRSVHHRISHFIMSYYC
jgi:hypothetical protein